MSADELFGGYSVLISYRAPYLESHPTAFVALNEFDSRDEGDFVVSKEGAKIADDRITNRNRLLNYLFDEASEYINDSKSNKDFKADVLNYTSLDRQLPFGLSDEYRDDIDSLRGWFDELGLADFRAKVDSWLSECQAFERRLEKIIDDRFDAKGRKNMLVKASIASHTSNPVAKCVLHATFRKQNTSFEHFLTADDSDLSKKERKVNEIIATHFTQREILTFISPNQIVKQYNLNS